ncbi:MAG: hypothetical protein ACOX8W_10100 [bacterium]|jgi:hypothetical protein
MAVESKATFLCADAGTSVCPCFLAEAGRCVQCSLLQGEELCNCRWSGICIYNEFGWAKEKARPGRKEIRVGDWRKTIISRDSVLLNITVPEELARECQQAGSFVLIKEELKPDVFYVPMTVMDVSLKPPLLKLAVQSVGPKTEALRQADGGLTLKGPYRNGLFGLRYLERLAGKKAMLFVRGICQAASVPVAKALVRQNNQCTAVFDPGKIGKIFVADYYAALKIPIREGSLLETEGRELMRRLLREEKPDLIFSGGANEQHEDILGEMRSLGLRIPFVVTSDYTICCGEGICGSCQITTADGQKVRSCKAKLSPDDIWG